MDTTRPFIEVKDITQAFGDQHVLRGVSFDLYEGELLVLIGGSGAGKSVILKHLVGLLDPISGQVVVDGQPMSDVPEARKAPLRAKIGFMFQQGALFDSMSVFENVAFPLIERGIKDPAVVKEKVEEALAAVELVGHGDKMPANLSGGMIKRVAVARAMVSAPECLLYDEPTAGLDPVVSDSVSYMIRRICVESGIATLVVTHDMSSVIHIADRVIFLDQGRVHWEGSPLDLVHSEDPLIKRFVSGNSGEDWSSVHNAPRPDFQSQLVSDALKQRYQQHSN
jgi:phospholipid/cholesterol/gamma-HCH transport system ATP-binding protein